MVGRMIVVALVAFVLVSAGPEVGRGQFPQPPLAQREAMKRLEFLVGEWKGDGWMDGICSRPAKRVPSAESVRSKLDGVLLTIDGLHRAKEGGAVVHNAFAVVTFDEMGKRYRFQAYTSRGNHEDAEATVTEKQLVWGMKIPRFGNVKYTIKLDDKGRWFEVGEVSQDGQAWRKFFEMTLERV